MKTLIGWRASEHNNFDGYVMVNDEIDRDIYDYFLEVLPPIYCDNGFMVSEPYSYSSKYNTQTFACYVSLGGKYYYFGNISPLAVKESVTRLKESLTNN